MNIHAGGILKIDFAKGKPFLGKTRINQSLPGA